MVLNRKQVITGPMIMQKTETFAKQFGSNFKPNTGWLARWKKQNGIKFKMAHGEKSSADFDAAEKWLTERMPEILENYKEDDIYNADETGLFYRATPDGTLGVSVILTRNSSWEVTRVTHTRLWSGQSSLP